MLSNFRLAIFVSYCFCNFSLGLAERFQTLKDQLNQPIEDSPF